MDDKLGFVRKAIMEIKWIDGFEIGVHVENGGVVISANREGLLSLRAKKLTVLAEGMLVDHIHYDEYNSLEEGSAGLIVERIRYFKKQKDKELSV